MVEFEGMNGRFIYINPRNVTVVKEGRQEGLVEVWFFDDAVTVKGDLDQVAEDLGV